VVSFPPVSHSNSISTSPLTRKCYMPFPPHSSGFDQPNTFLVRSTDHKDSHYVHSSTSVCSSTAPLSCRLICARQHSMCSSMAPLSCRLICARQHSMCSSTAPISMLPQLLWMFLCPDFCHLHRQEYFKMMHYQWSEYLPFHSAFWIERTFVFF
jgi:hypothetical protein